MRWFSSAADLQHRRVEGPFAVSLNLKVLRFERPVNEIASPRG